MFRMSDSEELAQEAASGSTNASALSSALFAIIWALDSPEFPILDSAGGASSRGASAAADFAANKRLTLKDMRGEFVRGWDDSRAVDTSRVLGSDQAEMIGPHTHAVGAADTYSGAGAVAGINPTGTSEVTDNNAGTENRPRNIAWLWCVWF
jgi:phage-related tail fiber protein